MSRITDNPPGRNSRLYQDVILRGGRNGLAIDSIATIEPGSSFYKNTTTAVTYAAPIVTFDSSIDLSSLLHFTRKFTGTLIFTDESGTTYFIDPGSINTSTHQLSIYLDTGFTQSPQAINLNKGWILSEAELVNRLATSSASIIDQVNFEGVDVSLQLNSKEDSVQVIGPSGNALDPNPDGSINTNVVLSSLVSSILVLGTEDGTKTGTQHVLKVGSDLKLRVRDDDANTTLSQIDTDLNSFKSQNHFDVLQVDSDLIAFKNANHTDLVQIDTDLVSFKTANHTDLVQVDTDLNSFKTANHTDLSQLDTDLNSFKSQNHSDITAFQSDFDTRIGATNETPPATDTAVSGLNGRLQRIAQRLTTIDIDLNTFASTNHADNIAIEANLTQIDTDLLAFKAANHIDLVQVDSDLLAFKAANHSDLSALQTENHTDLTQIDSDLLAFKSANHSDLSALQTENHTDLVQLDTDLLAFKAANHTDLVQLDTDLNSFKTANHTDLTAINTTLTNFDKNYGAVGTNTLRVASQPGNATGAADFNSGTTGAQTLRVSANISDGSANKITSTLINSKQRIDANLASEGTSGASVPFQTLQAGGKDVSGNLQPLPIDENGDLVTSDALRSFSAQSKVYSAQTPAILVGTTETALYLLRNPTGSGKTMKVFKLKLSGAGTFRVYYLPTITVNGTTVNPLLRKITSGAQGNIGLATSSPTATANGSLADTLVVTAQEGTEAFLFESYIILPANTSMLITAQMGANNTSTTAQAEWAEL